MSSVTAAADAHLAEVFAQASLEGFVHARDLDRGTELSFGGDVLCHSASTGKVPILVTLMRAIAAGEDALDAPVHVPVAGRTPGPTGLSVMKHDVTLTLRDVALLMIAQSDNHATDLVLKRVPPARVTATMRELGFTAMTFEITIAEMYQRAQDRLTGVTDAAKAQELMRSDPDLQGETAPWRTTPEEMTRLLALIWRDEAAPAEICDEMRTILRAYATSNGLASGFPLAVQMRIGGKTGTTMGVKNEIGVVEYPDGGRYAVAVFTRCAHERWKLYDARAAVAVGDAARIAVEELRGST